MAEDPDDKIDAARRRLMKIAIYVPPAVLGAVSLNSAAGCQGVSCPPGAACGPNNCHPVIDPCQPQNCNPNCLPRNPP